MDKKHLLWPALALTAALAPQAPLPAAAMFQVSNLNFNHAMLVNMVISAVQNNGNITNFDAGNDAGVLSVTVHNSGNLAGYLYLVPYIKQAGDGEYNCYSGGGVGNTVATGPLLQTRAMVQPGQTVVENIGSFQVASGSGYNGGFCANLQSLITGAFNNNSSSNGSGSGSSGISASSALSAVDTGVHELQQLRMTVCVAVANSNGSEVSGSGDQACLVAPTQIFNSGTGAITDLGNIIIPYNSDINTPIPTFVWTASVYNSKSTGLAYELVLSQSANGNPWYSVQVPNGQTFYQWQATDRALQPGVKYWFHVVTLLNGQPVGGVSSQGWNQPQLWFSYVPTGAAAGGVVTLAQLDALVRANGSAAVLGSLQGMQVQGVAPGLTLSDPDAAVLVAKPAEIKNISVEKF